MRSTLKSFVPVEKRSVLDGDLDSPSSQLVKKAKKKKANQSNVKSLGDKTFEQTQKVFDAHLSTTSSKNISMQFQQSMQNANFNTSRIKVKSEPNDTTKEDDNDELDIFPNSRKRKITTESEVPEPTIIKSMDDLMACEASLALLQCNPTRAGNPSTDLIEQIPPQHEAVSLIANKYEKNILWYDQMISQIVNSDGSLTVPDVPIFTREYLAPFFRAPCHEFERPCINLDRPPKPGEPKVQCIAHYQSEQLLGKGNGFRLRELLFKDEMISINRILSDNQKLKRQFQANKIDRKTYQESLQDPSSILSSPNEMCVMCHIWLTNKAYCDKRDRAIERKSRLKGDKSGSNDPHEDDYVTLLNRFMVFANQAGEYDLNMCIAGDTNFVGIWGCFPIWNISNYVVGNVDGVSCFYETDRLLFQPARDLRAINPSNKMLSSTTRSTHTLNMSRPLSDRKGKFTNKDFILQIIDESIETTRNRILSGELHIANWSFDQIAQKIKDFEEIHPVKKYVTADPIQQQELDMQQQMRLAKKLWKSPVVEKKEIETPQFAGLPKQEPKTEKMQFDQHQQHEEEEEEEQEEQEDEDNSLLIWDPSNMPLEWSVSYSWFLAIWLRVNVAHILASTRLAKGQFLANKLKSFSVQYHLAIVHYVEQIPDPCDENIDSKHLLSLYPGPEKRLSLWPDDLKLIQQETKTTQIRPTPLEAIRKRWPNLLWTPEQVAIEIRNGKITLNQDPKHGWIDDTWDVFDGNANVKTHTLYYSVLYILRQIKSCMLESKDDPIDPTVPSNVTVYDSLWFYYCSWVSLFDFCLNQPDGPRMDDQFLLTPSKEVKSKRRDTNEYLYSDDASPWELYGTMDERAFTACDLPDLYHVLFHIPLWGEQNPPETYIGHLIQKSLPFACQRRQIIAGCVKACREETGFFRLLSHLFWVFMANLYPGSQCDRETSQLDMRKLLRIRELTDPIRGKEKLIAALQMTDPGKKSSNADGGPLVMYTAFRSFIVYMAQRNPLYIEKAKECIDWDAFAAQTRFMSILVRNSNLFCNDPFAEARCLLSKKTKNPKRHVHRFRKTSMAVTIRDLLNKILEKDVLGKLRSWRQAAREVDKVIEAFPPFATKLQNKQIVADFYKSVLDPNDFQKSILPVCLEKTTVENAAVHLQKSISFCAEIINSVDNYKSNIVNFLLRVPPKERLSYDVLSCLLLPKYGAISHRALSLTCELTKTYLTDDKAVPSEFRNTMHKFDLYDFLVVTFFFNTVATLDQIELIPIDAETTKRQHEAMMHKRFAMEPGSSIPDSVYDVCFALCCQELCTMRGPRHYGDCKMSFELTTGQFICTKGKKAKRNKARKTKQKLLKSITLDEEEEEEEEEDGLVHLPKEIAVRDNITDSLSKKGRGKKKNTQMGKRKDLRKQRCAFSRIPCGQPVLKINLKGHALVYGSSLAKKQIYMFCPRDGAFHQYKQTLFADSADGYYRCQDCAEQEDSFFMYIECAFCQKNSKTHGAYITPKMCVTLTEIDKQGQVQFKDRYFCKSHYGLANYLAPKMTRDKMWIIMARKEKKKVGKGGA